MVVVLEDGVLGLMEEFEAGVFKEVCFCTDGDSTIFLGDNSDGVLEEIFWSFCGRLALS